MNDPFNYFNLSDFKKWINNHHDEKNYEDEFIGCHVRARPGIENLDEKIQIEYGDDSEILRQFLKVGGTVLERDGNKFLVDVDAGSFVCHKRFLKKTN